jgi:hypothetical protein
MPWARPGQMARAHLFGVRVPPNTERYAVAMNTGRKAEARDALAVACQEVGFEVTLDPPGSMTDLRLAMRGGAGAAVGIIVDVVEFGGTDKAKRMRDRTAHGTAPVVLVADRVTATAQAYMKREHVGWFDRRGHLHLDLPGVFVDADVTPALRDVTRLEDGIRGRAGMAYAVACLLADSDQRPTIRGVARETRFAPSVVSDAAASLRRAALVYDDGRPNIPDLFWALADRWRPEFVDLGGELNPGLQGSSGAVELGVFGEADLPGWALTGSVAAAAFGAPVVVSSATPPSFYVPDQTTLRRAVRRFGTADGEHRSCSVAVSPAAAACSPRIEAQSDGRLVGGISAPGFDHFLFTRPLFIALELANDPARGHEILEGWTPGVGTRVW